MPRFLSTWFTNMCRTLTHCDCRSAPKNAAIGPLARAEDAPRADHRLPRSRQFGFDRGRPIDRYYIEGFLKRNAGDVRGRVLEVGDASYTQRFGGARVTRSDVLNPNPGPGTTVVADLADAPSIADAAYDCLILTQVLPFVFDVHAVLRTAWRILAPGGVLLLTVPGISQISRYDADRWGDFWRFTPQGIARLLAAHFARDAARIETWGNVYVAAAFLDGRATEELTTDDLDFVDVDYPVTIAARAVRQD